MKYQWYKHNFYICAFSKVEKRVIRLSSKHYLRWISLFITIFLFPIEFIHAQSNVKGLVQDEDSHESLPFAIITVLQTSKVTVSNSDGYFVLVNCPSEDFKITVSFLGYATDTFLIQKKDIQSKYLIKVQLKAVAKELDRVEIHANSGLLQISDHEIGCVTISPRQLAQLPSVGQVDIFRSLQLLPGITAANDGESGLYVRGGTPDQNLILFDGMTIFHVDHFFGFFSAFNTDAIKSIQFYKGVFPAEYGGRVSSVLDITGKTGNSAKPQVSVGVNLLSANACVETPLKDVGSFIFTARRSYTDFLRSKLYNDIYRFTTGGTANSGTKVNTGSKSTSIQATNSQPDFYFYDINSKLTFFPSKYDVVSFSVYSGKDNLDNSQDYSNVSLQNDNDNAVSLSTIDLNKWGNFGVSTKWGHQWNKRFYTDIIASSSKYFSTFDKNRNISEIVSSSDSSGYSLVSSLYEDNQVKNYNVRMNVTFYQSENYTIKFGISNEAFRSIYHYTLDDTIPLLDMNSKGNLTSSFLQDKLDFNKWKFLVGSRASYYNNSKSLKVEPRFSVNYQFSKTLSVKGAYGYFNQYVIRVVNENVSEGSRDFWLLTEKKLKPLSSSQYDLGFSYETTDLLVNIEGYYKKMNHLVEFTRRFNNHDDNSDFFYQGSGFSKGLEFLVQKKTGNLTGWLTYTLSKTMKKFSIYNNGDYFPSDEDRRHELKDVLKYSWKRWTFANITVFSTGKPYTAAQSQYYLDLLNGEHASYVHVGPKNGDRLLAYFRLDISASYQFRCKIGNIDCGISLFNLTNHKNIWRREYNMDTFPVVVNDVQTLGFTPTLFINFKTI